MTRIGVAARQLFVFSNKGWRHLLEFTIVHPAPDAYLGQSRPTRRRPSK